MIIRFSEHALEKFNDPQLVKFRINREMVEYVVMNPEQEDRISRPGQVIAQRLFDRTHVLRVVYKQEFNYVKIITLYVGRKKQYAS
ncbi:MAG: hypothetical protein QG607_12 [Patescibacteria group bacterium]|nr:hypothetical protein [Patescibacteria group bacterium]